MEKQRSANGRIRLISWEALVLHSVKFKVISLPRNLKEVPISLLMKLMEILQLSLLQKDQVYCSNFILQMTEKYDGSVSRSPELVGSSNESISPMLLENVLKMLHAFEVLF